MSHLTDFGPSRRDWMAALMPRMVVAGAVALVAGATIWELAAERHTIAQSSADTNVAAIVGPPCPALSAAAFQTAVREGPGLAYSFDFNGATFGRSFGYADCSVAEAKGSLGLGSYDVCQFTSPAILYVKTARGAFYFQPGIGQKATVMTPDGQARCVMAAPKWDNP
jgi:hypothetical protein